MMGPNLPGFPSVAPGQDDRYPRRVMAAVFAAAGNGCECEPCKILRQLAGSMKDDLLK